jgi:hypothetical protein
MADLPTTIKNEAQRLACVVLSNEDAARDFLGRRTRALPGMGFAQDAAGAPFKLLKYFACGDQPPESRPGDMPFGDEGIDGQPPSGFNYDGVGGVNMNFKNAQGQPRNVFTRQFTYTLGQFGWEATSRRCDGVVANVGSFQPGSIQIVSTGICTGQGGELPDFTYDKRPYYRGPVTYDGPNGPVTVDVDVKLDDPKSDPGGGLTIPFFWIDPDLVLKPDLNLDIEPEIDFNPGRKCGPDIDLPDLDLDDNDTDPPEPENDSVLAGVIVTTTVITTEKTTGRWESGSQPAIYIPRCATVIFATNVGGVRCWTEPTDVQTLRQWIPVKGEVYPYDAVVKSSLGFESTIEKVYVKGSEPDFV